MYEAVDLDLEIPVALKVLRPEYAGQPAAEARFRREATTAARLRHPNIVFIRNVGEGDGTVFVAMDLLPLSLARRLEVFPRLPETEVVRFALEVAAALAIAHADGVVHRDIKPDNVMLGAHGEAIVADFGLAGAFTKDTGRSELTDGDHPGKVMGTPHYFSPEQARGSDLDGRSDLYSLGVMCYRAATGTLPFEGDDWYSVARQHVEDAPVPPRMLVPELTEGFEAIVLRLLAKKPEQRFASATQLADALLTLSTAPASHSVGLTPSSASVTQVAFPYLYSAVGKRSWKRNVLLSAMALVATAAVAVFVWPTAAGLQRTVFSGLQELPPTTPVVLDTTPIFPNDSVQAPLISPPPAPVVTKPPAKAAAIIRPPVPPARVYVTLTAPDSARLQVNGDSTKSDYGMWQGWLPTSRKQYFSAYLESPLKGCKSAQIDTSLTFNTAQATVNFDVALCSVLLLTVRNASSAVWTMTSLDNKVKREGRILDTTTPIVMRNGQYELVVIADKCSNWVDKKLIIGRDPVTGSDTVPKLVIMNCAPPDRDR